MNGQWFVQPIKECVLEDKGKRTVWDRIDDCRYEMSRHIDVGWLYLKIRRWWLGYHRWPGPLMVLKIFYQRGRYGYAESDLWNFDGYLSEMLARALKEFKKDTIGHPCELTPDEWDAKLYAMITGFETLAKLQDMEYFEVGDVEGSLAREKELVEVFDAGMKEFGRYFMSLWW